MPENEDVLSRIWRVWGPLIFPLIGLIGDYISCLYQLILKMTAHQSVVLTTPENMGPSFGFYVTFMVIDGVLLWFFLKRSKILPALFITYLLGTVVITVIGLNEIMSMAAVEKRKIMDAFFQSILGILWAVFWALYFMFSNRVKETFGKRDSGPSN